MAGLTQFREQHPEYNDMPDAALSDALYSKFYSDMPRDQYDAKMGVDSGATVTAKSQRGIGAPQPEPGFFERGGTMDQATSRVAHAATSSFGDEAAGLGTAAGRWLRQHLPLPGMAPVPPSDFAQDYQQGADRDRQMQQKFGENHPVLAPVLDVVGSFGGMKGPALPAAAPAMAPAASRSAQVGRYGVNVAKGAAGGAVAGGVAGFGEGQGFEDRLSRAGTGAAAGAVFGAAIKPVADTVGGVWGALKAIAGGGNKDVAAQRMVVAALQKDGISPEEAARKVANWRMQGSKPETLAELGGDATRRLARSVYTVGGEGGSQVEKFMSGRADDRLDRIAGDLGSTLTPERNVVYEATGDLATQHQAAINQAQTDARAAFTDVVGQAPAGQTIEQHAGTTIRDRLAAQRDALNATRQRAAGTNYGAVTDSPVTVNTDPVLDLANQKLTRFENTKIGGAVESARQSLLLKSGTPKTQMDQMQGALSDIRDQADTLRQAGNRKAAQHVGEVADALEAQINDADLSLQRANSAYAEASRPLDPYNKPDVGNTATVLKQTSHREGYVVDPEKVPATYFNNGKTAASDMQEFHRLAGNDPAAVGSMRRYVVKRAMDASTARDGSISAERLQGWITDHADAIGASPQIGNDLQAIAARVQTASRAATESAPARSLRAIDRGRSFLSEDPEVIHRELAAMAPAERELYRVSAIRALRDQMGGGGGTNAMTAAYSGGPRHTNMRNRIAAVFGNDETYQRFASLAEREANMVKNERFIMGGSQTTNKAQDVENPLADIAIDVASNGGSIRPTVTKLLLKAAARSRGVTPGRAAALAPYFTATGPELSTGLFGLSGALDQRLLDQSIRNRGLLGATVPAAGFLSRIINQ